MSITEKFCKKAWDDPFLQKKRQRSQKKKKKKRKLIQDIQSSV